VAARDRPGARRPAPPPPPEPPGPGDQARAILLEATRTQLAAVTAAAKFWAGWAESANRYAQAISDEVAALEDTSDSQRDLVARATSLTREYLREMAVLPDTAVRHFNAELERIGKPKPKAKRTRAARVKD
jgi:hypothetical protein